jgi:DNA-binding transcriptional LysR family regulator
MTERMSLRRLAYFVTAAERGTMTAAAQVLHVSQSAVSLAIADLERQLGVQLLLRHKAKGLTLTEAGRGLLPEAIALLSRTDELQAGMHDLGHSPTGRLVIGCFTTIAPFVLPELLEEFQEAYREVTLDFVEGSQVLLHELLLESRCELAVLYDIDIQPGIDYDVLYATKPHVLLPPRHPLARLDSVRLADLAEHDMIMLDVPPSFNYFSQVLAAAGIKPRIRHRTVSFEMVRSLVARGVGYSLLIQQPTVDLSYEGRDLVIRPVRDRLVPMPVVLARPSGIRLTRRAEVFAEFCHTRLADGPHTGGPRTGG